MKTGIEFEQYVSKLIIESPISDLITGDVYLAGLRPQNSKLEDVVVGFQTGLDGQFQKGNINVNIFVPDIVFTDKYGVASNIKNFTRCSKIERACVEFVESLRADKFRFRLVTTIQTHKHEDIDQHFINMRLRYIYVTI